MSELMAGQTETYLQGHRAGCRETLNDVREQIRKELALNDKYNNNTIVKAATAEILKLLLKKLEGK